MDQDISNANGDKTIEDSSDVAPTQAASNGEICSGKLKVGDLDSAGQKIKDIFACGDNWIVYTTESESLVIQHDQLPDHLAPGMAEYENCRTLARTKLKGAYRVDINYMMARALTTLMYVPQDGDPVSPFIPVRKFIEERGPVQTVFASGKDFIIFLDKESKVQIEFEKVSPAQSAAVQEFKRLQNLAESSLPTSYADTARQILGDELSVAFRTESPVDVSALFESSRGFIEKRAQSIVRSRYTLSSVLSAFILLFLLLKIDPLFWLTKGVFQIAPGNLHLMTLGAIGGGIGALVSVMQRGQSLEYERFVSTGYMIFLGVVRIILGTIFGGLAVVAVKANMALGIINGNQWTVIILCVASGFSERFIPDILTGVATQNKDQPGKK